MHAFIIAVAITVMVGCSPAKLGLGVEEQPSPPVAVELQPGSHVPVSVQGTWQLFYLPDEWLMDHWKGEGITRGYVALAPPHVEDLQGDYAPCDPPGRIVLGIVDGSGSTREQLAACLVYCSEEDTPDHMYRDLWGSLTHLTGITVQILGNGSINVIEHYRKKAFVPPEIYEAPMIVDKLSLEGEVRVRHHTIAPSAFAFSGKVAGSCIAMSEPGLE